MFMAFVALVVTFMVIVAAKLFGISTHKSDDEIQEDFMSEIEDVAKKNEEIAAKNKEIDKLNGRL
jgi:predicted RNA-binding protein with RPS1 domain